MGGASRRTPGVLELSVDGPFDADAAEAAESVVFHPEGKAPPLVLVRTWDWEVAKQRNLARALGTDQPLYSIAPPAHAQKGDYPMTTDAWCAFFLAKLADLPVEDPLRLGGWSFGGVVALEMAEALRREGRETERVLMLDTRLPAFHAKPRRGKRSSRLFKLSRRLDEYVRLPTPAERRAFLRRRAGRVAQKSARRTRRLLRLDPGRRAAKPIKGRAGVHLTSHGVPMSLLKVAVRTAYLKYRRHVTSVPIAQFWTRESMKKSGKDATLGWGRYARGPFETVGIGGDHSSMFDEEFAPRLAACVRASLRRRERDRDTPASERAVAPSPASASRRRRRGPRRSPHETAGGP